VVESHVMELHAVERLAAAVEIVRVALFLATPESSFMVGCAVPVDGGLTAQ
jgi:NAD(P)-dependent dehydrogenase (short-subunit alcohol dehydrogenase family)